VYHHFWFLQTSVAGMPLQTVCKLVLAAMVPAALLPGLVRSGGSRSHVAVLLITQVPALMAARLPSVLGSLGRQQAISSQSIARACSPSILQALG